MAGEGQSRSDQETVDNLKGIVKSLRKRLTDAEKVLWKHLRAKQLQGLKFRRQEPIGKYVVDFVCYQKRIVVEVDGGQHSKESSKDEERDRWFQKEGYKVLRFWNNDVLTNTDGVLEVIMKNVSPSPGPSHRGRGKNQIRYGKIPSSKGRKVIHHD